MEWNSNIVRSQIKNLDMIQPCLREDERATLCDDRAQNGRVYRVDGGTQIPHNARVPLKIENGLKSMKKSLFFHFFFTDPHYF